MNIVMINGSYKRKGVTAGVLAQAAELLRMKEDAQVTMIQLSDYSMAYCSGCTTCYSKGVCPLDKKDGFDKVRNAIEEADGVILSSPNYVSTVTGLFKTFIDRMDFVTGQVLHNKYAMVVSTYQNVRGNKVNSYITEQARLAGGRVRGSINLKKDPYKRPYSFEMDKEMIQRQVDKFYQSIKVKDKKNMVEQIYGFFAKRALRGFLDDKEHYGGLIKGWQAKGIL